MLQKNKGWPELRGLALVAGTLAWLAGILLDAWTLFPTPALLIGAALALLCAIALWRNGRGRLIALLAFFFLLGAWRYALASPVGDHTAISAFTGVKKLDLMGSVTDEPKLEARSQLLSVAVSSVSLDNGNTWRNAHGLVDVQIPGNMIDDPYGPHYGDDVELLGNLQPPPPNSGLDIFASMSFPRLSISQSGGNPFIAALYSLRIYLATIITRTLPQPMAALLIAVVLSLRTPALKILIPLFNVTGTAHLIAPSGFKVTILAGLVADNSRRLFTMRKKQFQRLLPAEKQKKNWWQLLSSGLVILSILGYTFLSGGSPAALRAGIMGIMLVLAPRFGRIYNVYNALALAALLMSVLDPFVLWDAGFQLSLFGTLGIIIFTPLLMRPFHRFERVALGHFFTEIVMVTLAAEIATLPVFALTFHQLSLISPVTNILTVPLLPTLIMLGLLVCAAGAIWLPAGLLCGWVVWPLLWYVITVVSWCAALPGAYLSVSNLTTGAAWGYYALLVLVASMLLRRWPSHQQSSLLKKAPPLVSKRAWRLLQACAALAIMLATGTTAIASRTSDQLTITFLNVGPAGQSSQGEAILIRTQDGKTALIDGGLDATSLASTLDTRLPFWQRSLDMVILTAPRQDELVGLADIVSRYQVGEAIDAGMLHPNAGYALYRRTISERNIPYEQLRQGATITLGTQVAMQVFWPTSPLHKGSEEAQDNGLIVRLLAPGLSMLLLGATALSKYALTGLLTTVAHSNLTADVVQIIGEAGKAFPAELQAVLQTAHPSLVVISPATLSAKLRKTGAISVLAASLQALGGTWQFAQTAQVGTIEISSNGRGWTMRADA
ncbi:MAG: DNA internalization-related competence protein ComEC/Rec2 [Ktedonobacteraceae bacterium]